MINDSYTSDYDKRQSLRLLQLMKTSKPLYNFVEVVDNEKIRISCDKLFPKTFDNVQEAIKWLEKHQKNGCGRTRKVGRRLVMNDW